jgi:hypothetical protein
MKRAIIALAALASVVPSIAHAELYEQIKWCRGNLAVGLACFVVQKGVAMEIEKKAEEWVALWIGGEGRQAPLDAEAIKLQRWKDYRDFRSIMTDTQEWNHLHPQARQRYEKELAELRDTIAKVCVDDPTALPSFPRCPPKK